MPTQEERLRALEREIERLRQAPRHGHRPPGVVALDDDVIVGGGEGRGRYRLLNFRDGLTATDGGDRVDIDATGGGVGAGPFCYDYLVDNDWAAVVAAGDGTEGQVFTTFHGHQFRVYSAIQPAVNNAESRQASGAIATDVSIAICPGLYSENIVLGATAGLGSQHGLLLIGHGVSPAQGVTQSTGLVEIGNNFSVGPAIDIVSGFPYYVIENVNLNVIAGGRALRGSGFNVEVVCRNVKFADGVSGDFAGAFFDNCDFREGQGYVVDAGHTPATVTFDHCQFGLNRATWVGGASQHHFLNCTWITANGGIDIIGGNNEVITFDGCMLATTGGGQFMTISGAFTTVGRLCFTGGTRWNVPPTGFPCLYIAGGGTIVRGLVVVGTTFLKANGVTEPYIKSDANAGDVTNCIIAGNSFGFDGFGDVYIETEDPTKASVVGNFDESVFGPNSPGTIVQYNITGVRNEFYPADSAIGPSVGPSVQPFEFYISFGSVLESVGP